MGPRLCELRGEDLNFPVLIQRRHAFFYDSCKPGNGLLAELCAAKSSKRHQFDKKALVLLFTIYSYASPNFVAHSDVYQGNASLNKLSNRDAFSAPMFYRLPVPILFSLRAMTNGEAEREQENEIAAGKFHFLFLPSSFLLLRFASAQFGLGIGIGRRIDGRMDA